MKNRLIAFTSLSLLGLLNLQLTADAQPVVTTLAASGVTVTNATLNGTINPNGASSTAYFQYGLTTNYDNISAATVLPSGNAAVAVPGFVVDSTRGPAGANVATATSPNLWWGALAASADGLRMAAAATSPGGIWLSTNGGGTWTASSAIINYWHGIASSADGARLAAVAYSGGWIYISTDSGLTWTNTSPINASWRSIASSADGLRLATAGSEGVYTSTNGGLDWRLSTPSSWRSIASSADGMRLTGVQYNDGIYTSTNGGLTWTLSGAPLTGWQCIASSADGTRLVAGGYTNIGVYTSADSGLTWQRRGLSRDWDWTGAASSADGMRLAMTPKGGFVSTSTDGGASWTFGSFAALWHPAALSADGTRLVTAQERGFLWTSAGAPSNLLPGTAYHYRLAGINSAGTTLGSDMIFTTGAGAPTVTTLATSDVRGTNATLNGTVNTGGLSTTAYFQYGLTTNYGSFSATNNLAATNTTISVANFQGGLAPVTTYHFRLVGSNSMGTAVGVDQVFTTTLPEPVVTTLAASSVTPTNALLNGTVNPSGTDTTAYFQYGLTTNYGSVTATSNLAATNANLSISNLIGGLLPATTYHFRVVASNGGGTSLGGNQSFTTTPLAPTVVTLAATSVTVTNSTLHGTVNPHGSATTTYFRYGLTSGYGSYSATNTLAGTNATLSVSSLIINLTPGTTYHFQLVAENSAGTTLGGDLTFTTVTPPASAYGQAVLADHPLGYWRLDETTGTVARDYFASNHGVYTNTLLGQPGNSNVDAHTAAKFGSLSSSNSFVGGVPFGFATAGNAAFSIECWVNGGAQTTDSGIITRGTGGNEQFNLDCGSTSHGFRFFVRDAAGGAHLANGTVVPNNTWHHLVGVCDEANGLVVLYVDGISNASGTITPGSGLLNTASTTAFGSRQSGTGAYDFQFVGLLEEVAIYAYALSPVQVLSHYRVTLPPTVATRPASGITATNATLNGLVTPNGSATTAYFQYGLTTNYGSFSSTNTLAATNVALAVSNLISGLISGTTYHFRLVAGSQGNGVGSNLTFTTGAGGPTVTTSPATGISDTSATLNGTVLSGGLTTAAYFEYGLTSAYGSYSTTNTVSATTEAVPVAILLTVSPASTYHYRLIGINSAGTSVGNELTFSTAIGAPTVTTLAATSVTRSNATLNGTVNPNGLASSAYFQYGLTTNYGSLGTLTALPSTNFPLTVPSLVVTSITGAAGAHWTSASVPNSIWNCIVSSADGTRLAAGINGGGIYTSLNGGTTWVLSSAPTAAWKGIASSASGLRFAACSFGGGIYTTTNSGAAWTPSGAPAAGWTAIASSSDGTRLAAVINNGDSIYTSTNRGATWTPAIVPTLLWSSIASSSDGMRLAAAASGAGSIHTSTNGGVTWTLSGAPTDTPYNSIASSIDGMRLVAAAIGDRVYISTNGGAIWTPSSAPAFRSWNAVASSFDGQRLSAGINGGTIYSSTNGGTTWTSSDAPSVGWWSIACSADGGRLVAAANGNGISRSIGAASPLLPNATYHYRLVGINNLSLSYGSDLTFITLAPFTLTGMVRLPNGSFQFGFSSQSGIANSVLASVNLVSNTWSNIGSALETPPGSGDYRFIDTQATNYPRRFYRVRSP